MDIPVVYEDEHILAVNKPAGLAVHKVSPTDPQETLADILVRERPYLAGVGESPLRPGIAHRLDKETSGIILVAKDQPTFRYLKDLFQTRRVKKEYLALVHGRPKEPHGTIDLPLGKLGTRQTTQLEGRHTLTGRRAVTGYRTERNFRNYTLLRVTPETGRTHQIRVHLKTIGHPVVGDQLYGKKGDQGPLFLFAQRLSFTASDGKALTLEASLPASLQNTLDALE
jgi:23S rRNA pseudouridine1911/1915/1917 synthase